MVIVSSGQCSEIPFFHFKWWCQSKLNIWDVFGMYLKQFWSDQSFEICSWHLWRHNYCIDLLGTHMDKSCLDKSHVMIYFSLDFFSFCSIVIQYKKGLTIYWNYIWVPSNGLCAFCLLGTLWLSQRFSGHISFWRRYIFKVDFQVMLYLYQTWYRQSFRAQFHTKPCFPWPLLHCPEEISWSFVERYQ